MSRPLPGQVDSSFLTAAFQRYRQERDNNPAYFHNELAERAQALAVYSQALHRFITGNSGLGEFTRTVADFSRAQYSQARGRNQTRYWRFNNAGRLFLDSYLKLAGRAGHLNSADLALKTLLNLPATLDAAGSQLEAFSAF